MKVFPKSPCLNELLNEIVTEQAPGTEPGTGETESLSLSWASGCPLSTAQVWEVSPGWCGSVDWQQACKIKSCWFNS